MTMWIRVPGPRACTEPTKREAQHRDVRLTKQLRRGNPTRARNYLAVVGRQHRIHEAEALDLLAGSSGILGDALAVALGEWQS
jgi:hypothetical protein